MEEKSFLGNSYKSNQPKNKEKNIFFLQNYIFFQINSPNLQLSNKNGFYFFYNFEGTLDLIHNLVSFFQTSKIA